MPSKSTPSRYPMATTSRCATAADAQIILQLYDLRRDTEMRKARHFISAEFWPESAEDTLRIAREYPGPEKHMVAPGYELLGNGCVIRAAGRAA